MQLPDHGANPHHVYEKFGMTPPMQILDFSENVNPAGFPERVYEMWTDLMAKLTIYPDPEAEPFLSAAAHFHNIGKESLFAGNGAAELLALVAERYRDKKAIVVHPTFSEYEATLKAKNVEIIRILSSEEEGFSLPLKELIQAMETASVLYLCTPNNPTGIMPGRDELDKLVRRGAEVGCDVVLDEAFIDFVDESLSFIPRILENAHVTVVRSMTKMYAMPGIRLGYIVAAPSVIEEIKALAPHWNVNGIAAHIGAACLTDEPFRERAIKQSADEREELTLFLRKHGCLVTDSVANFLSFTPGAGQDVRKLYRHLLTRGIVLRHSENFIGMDGKWLRVGMKNRAAMNLLKEELSVWFAEN